MMLYLKSNYHMTIGKVLAISHLFWVLSSLIPTWVVSSPITIVLCSVANFLGVGILWLTRPPPCDPITKSYKPATAGQLTMLVCALFFMSIGAGGLGHVPCRSTWIN